MPGWELPIQLEQTLLSGVMDNCSAWWSQGAQDTATAWLPCRREEVPRHECFLCIPLEPTGLKSDEAGLSMAGAMVLLVGQRRGFLRVWTDCCCVMPDATGIPWFQRVLTKIDIFHPQGKDY